MTNWARVGGYGELVDADDNSETLTALQERDIVEMGNALYRARREASASSGMKNQAQIVHACASHRMHKTATDLGKQLDAIRGGAA